MFTAADVVIAGAGASGLPAAIMARYNRTTMEEVFLDVARGRAPAGAAASGGVCGCVASVGAL